MSQLDAATAEPARDAGQRAHFTLDFCCEHLQVVVWCRATKWDLVHFSRGHASLSRTSYLKALGLWLAGWGRNTVHRLVYLRASDARNAQTATNLTLVSIVPLSILNLVTVFQSNQMDTKTSALLCQLFAPHCGQRLKVGLGRSDSSGSRARARPSHSSLEVQWVEHSDMVWRLEQEKKGIDVG